MLYNPLAPEEGWGGASLVPLQQQTLQGHGPGKEHHLPLTPLQKKLQDQRQYVVAEFEQGHQFLRERERHLLEQLAKLEQELTEGREKFKSRGVGELARLALVISELEGKAQQPAAELLQVSGLPGTSSGQPAQEESVPELSACRTSGERVPHRSQSLSWPALCPSAAD